MLLHEKLSALQQSLKIKNAALARESGLDAASVSRFLLGKRLFPYKYLPLLCDTMARMFPQGVEGESLPEELRELTGDGQISSEALSESALIWLQNSPEYDNKKSASKNSISRKKTKKAPRTSLKAFGEKLTLLMDSAGISGTQLAGALHVDPSLISKYRIGVRSPSEDAIKGAAAYICSHVKTADERRRILEAAGAGSEADNLTFEDFLIWVEEWLSEGHTWEISAIESLLETLDDFSYFGDSSGVIPLDEIASLAEDISKNESFWGIEGMRLAATRYLYYGATLDEPSTLCICTTSSLDFLTQDLRWKAVWASLMIHCLLRGHTIKIIYNMADRSVVEIMDAIEAFVPLYMVGNMEPYAFKGPQDNSMRHTIYLIPNHVAVTASYAEGLDDEGEYVYSTEPRRLAAQKKYFDALLSDSNRLMDIYRITDGMEGFDIRLGRFWSLPGKATLLLPSLSLSTLPETALNSALERSGYSIESCEKIRRVHAAARQWMILHLNTGMLDELSVIAGQKELEEGEVFLDIPAHLVPKPISYTAKEYAAHLAHIRRLEKRQPNYRFHDLLEAPFRNIKVYHKPSEVIVQKAGYPAAAFAIGNVYMCRGFEQFLPQLKQK